MCNYWYTDSPLHVVISAATLPRIIEHSVYYYLNTAKWTKKLRKDSPVGL